MIAFFNSFFVEGLDYITIFPDDRSPYQFYYFKTRPRIKPDAKGVPDIRYTMIQGSLDQEMSQYGLLLLGTDLGLTADEEKAIREYLAAKVNDAGYRQQIKIFYPVAYQRLYDDTRQFTQDAKEVISLGCFQAKEGTCSLELMGGLEGDRFKRYQSGENHPSLSGTFNNAFSATFGDLGAQLMLDTLKGNVTKDATGVTIPTLSIVRYELTGEFFIPAVQLTIHVETETIHQKLREIIQRQVVQEKSIKFKVGSYCFVTQGKVYLNRPAIREILEVGKTALVNITESDFSSLAGAASTDFLDKIRDSVMDVITGSILTSVFTPVPVQDSGAAGEVTYTLQDELPENGKQSFDLTFSKNTTVPLTLHANGSLFACVSKEHQKSLITDVDLSHTEFMKRSVAVSCQPNLYVDQIESVVVHCEYDHKDARFRKDLRYAADLEFKTGDDCHIFDFFMCKDASGKFMEDFVYKTQVNFIGKKAGEWSAEKRMTETVLKVTYENLGYLNVKCRVGDVDWKQVERVFVWLDYPAAANEKDTSVRLEFREGDTEKAWNCYKYGQASKEYRYRVVFQDKDGAEYPESPAYKTTSTDSLVIDDLYLGQAMEADFRISSIPESVDYILLDVYYSDEKLHIAKKDSHSFRGDDREWHWQMRLQEGAVEKIRYVYTVVYRRSDTPSAPVDMTAE